MLALVSVMYEVTKMGRNLEKAATLLLLLLFYIRSAKSSTSGTHVKSVCTEIFIST